MSDNLVCCSESAVRHQAPCGLLYPIIAHLSDNVNFLPDNVKRHNVANRSHNAVGRARNAQRRHRLGDRNSCLGDRNSCRPNRAPQIAPPLNPLANPHFYVFDTEISMNLTTQRSIIQVLFVYCHLRTPHACAISAHACCWWISRPFSRLICVMCNIAHM